MACLSTLDKLVLAKSSSPLTGGNTAAFKQFWAQKLPHSTTLFSDQLILGIGLGDMA